MKIETNYNINDEVWALFGNKVLPGKVVEMDIKLFKERSEKPYIYYSVWVFDEEENPVKKELFLEHSLFKSKKELIESL